MSLSQMQTFQVVIIAVIAVAFTTAAMFSDLRTRRIPNWLTAPTLLAALVAHTAMRGLEGLYFSLAGFGAGFGVLFLLWLIGGGGGGDVKMMAALGAWLGWALTVEVFLVSAAVTAVIAGARLSYAVGVEGYARARRRFMGGGERREASADPQDRKNRQRRLVPYAVPVALSTWIVLAVAWKTGFLP